MKVVSDVGIHIVYVLVERVNEYIVFLLISFQKYHQFFLPHCDSFCFVWHFPLFCLKRVNIYIHFPWDTLWCLPSNVCNSVMFPFQCNPNPNPNPAATGVYPSLDCQACTGGGGGPCRKSNVLYEFSCQQCPTDKPAVYVGETARNLYTRGREHFQNYQRRQPDSFMIKHQQDRYAGAEEEYKAKVICSFNDCLSRQIAEGVQIRRCEKEVLNTKAEWHQPALWKVRSELCREWQVWLWHSSSVHSVDIGCGKWYKQNYW